MELAHRDRFGDTCKSVGAELKAFYFTFGQYDMIAIVEAPSDEAMAQAVLSVGRHRAVRTETLKAFSEAEGLEIFKRLQ